jgi:hypothetical protein
LVGKPLPNMGHSGQYNPLNDLFFGLRVPDYD